MTRIGGKKARRPGPGAGGCGAERLIWAAGRRGARGGRHRKPAELGRALGFTTSAGWGSPGAPGRRWPFRLGACSPARARPAALPGARLGAEGTFLLPSTLGSSCSFWSPRWALS